VDSRIVGERSADLLELGFLLIARDGDATPLVGGDTLLQRRVVEGAAQTKHASQFPLLFRGGLEFVLVRLAHRLLFHRLLFCLIGTEPPIAGTTG
jgi:hypothetical protein